MKCSRKRVDIPISDMRYSATFWTIYAFVVSLSSKTGQAGVSTVDMSTSKNLWVFKDFKAQRTCDFSLQPILSLIKTDSFSHYYGIRLQVNHEAEARERHLRRLPMQSSPGLLIVSHCACADVCASLDPRPHFDRGHVCALLIGRTLQCHSM